MGGRRAGGADRLDVSWARSAPARLLRAAIQSGVVVPVTSLISPVHVVGRERLRALEPPVVVIANHQSHLDVPVTLTAVGRRLRRRLVVAAAADYFYRNRLTGAAVSLSLGTVPFVRTGGSSRASLEALKGLLREGWSVLIFPSGTRSDQDAFKKGFAFLAVDTATTVVPLCLHGLKDALPKGSVVPLPGGVVVGVGEPLAPGTDYDALVARAERAFLALRDQVQERIAGWGQAAAAERAAHGEEDQWGSTGSSPGSGGR